jgi:hypothetical protein
MWCDYCDKNNHKTADMGAIEAWKDCKQQEEHQGKLNLAISDEGEQEKYFFYFC